MEEEDARWQEIIEERWVEMMHKARLRRGAKGPPEVYVDASMEQLCWRLRSSLNLNNVANVRRPR
jgi:hypothetical protein